MLIDEQALHGQSKSSAVSPSPGTGANPNMNSGSLNRNTRYRQEIARRNLFDNAMKRMQEYLEKQKKSTER